MDEKCDGAFLEEVEGLWEFQHTIAAYTFPRLLKLAKMSDQLQVENERLEEKVMRIEKLRIHYRSIGFDDTAKQIDQALNKGGE